MKLFSKILLVAAVLLIVFSIFISTRKGNYEVSKKQLIKAPVSVVFSKVNHFKTWQEWGPWAKMDSSIVVTYGAVTSGKGANYSWTSQRDRGGSIRTESIVPNQAIDQKIVFNQQQESDVYWRFEEKEAGTEVTWGMKGDLDFVGKAFFYIMGGAERIMTPMLNDGLTNLDRYIQSDMKRYSITKNGLVDYAGGYFVYNTTECSFDEMGVEMDRMLPEVLIYCMQKQFPRAGSLFNLYHKYDEKSKRVEFSCCVPVKEHVKTDADFALAFMERGQYYKTSLQGDYKNSKEAWKKAYEFAKEDGVKISETGQPFEVYTIGHTKSENPADWVTEIYLPVE